MPLLVLTSWSRTHKYIWNLVALAFINVMKLERHWDVAQSVERLLCMWEVWGSIPHFSNFYDYSKIMDWRPFSHYLNLVTLNPLGITLESMHVKLQSLCVKDERYIECFVKRAKYVVHHLFILHYYKFFKFVDPNMARTFDSASLQANIFQKM